MLYRRTGDHAKAEEHFITATAMYRDMGMNLWLDKAEASRRRVPEAFRPDRIPGSPYQRTRRRYDKLTDLLSHS